MTDKEITFRLPSTYEVDELFFINSHITSQILDLGVKNYKLLKENKGDIYAQQEYIELITNNETLEKHLQEKQCELQTLQNQFRQLENELLKKHSLTFEIESIKLKNAFQDEINIYKKQIYELQNVNENAYNDYHVKLQSVVDLFTKEKEIIKNQSRNEYEQMKRLQESVYQEKINGLMVYKERSEENEHRVWQLQKKNEDLLERASFLSKSSNKGKEGELFLQSYFTDKFPLSKFFDMTSEPHHGDFHLHLTNAKLLIESKNVERIQKVRDLDKFVNDIQTCSDQNKINAGLFICLNDIVVKDGIKHFIFEFIDNIPVIYISNVINNVDLILMSVLILEQTVTTLNCYKQSSEEFENTRRNIIDTLKIVIQHIDNLTNDIIADEQDIHNLMSRIQRKKDNMKTINMNIMGLISNDKSLSNMPLVSNVNQNEQFETCIISKIKEHFVNQEIPHRVTLKQLQDMFPHDIHLIKKIGIKRINEQLK